MSKKAAPKAAAKPAASKRASAPRKKSSGADPKLDTAPQGPPAHQAEVGSGPPPRLSAEDQRIENIKKDAKARAEEQADPDELVEMDEQPEGIPDPIRGNQVFDGDASKDNGRMKAERKEPQPVYVTRAAKEKAEEEVVSYDKLDSMCNDLEAARTDVEDKQPEVVNEFNLAMRGLMNLRNALLARKERILNEGQQAALRILSRKREEQAREEAEADNKKG